MDARSRKNINILLDAKGLSLLPNGLTRLAGDGSERRFFRVAVSSPVSSVIAVIPPGQERKHLAEAHSSFAIADYLASIGVPVPRLYGFDRLSGILLFEDVGDLHLSAFLGRLPKENEERERLYRRVIDILVHMQLAGASGLLQSMCYDAFHYDRRTMVEKEGLYFARSFGRDMLGLDFDERNITAELYEVADQVTARLGPQGNDFFLHRDFQSRNIMLQDGGEIRILDFQAARKGPLAYDLASLLIDPYAELAESLQQRLFDYYCERLGERHAEILETVVATYPFLALQRNMQMLGAFAFLSEKKKKSYFAAFIPLALHRLTVRLTEAWAAPLNNLRRLALQMENKIASGIPHA